MIVSRPQDLAIRDALQPAITEGLPLRIIPVLTPGLLAARNTGLEACWCDFIAMTDDDAVPHPDWLARILEDFRLDSSIAGVGGRDRCLATGGRWNEGRKTRVGMVNAFGRMSGYHHLGFGSARMVHVLKGANMSYRMHAVGSLRVGTGLRGRGAQAHEDAQFSLSLRQRGGLLLYDPAVLVDHYEAPREEARHYGGISPVTDAEAFKEGPYNWVIALRHELSLPRHFAFVLWNLLVGTRVAPGLIQAVRFTPTLGRASWYRFWLTQQATFEAYRQIWREQRTRSAPVE